VCLKGREREIRREKERERERRKTRPMYECVLWSSKGNGYGKKEKKNCCMELYSKTDHYILCRIIFDLGNMIMRSSQFL